MEPAGKNGKIYEFDGFELIPAEDLLLRDGTPVSLNQKALRVLTLLVEHSGHLVTKSEIIESVWEDAFVEEGSLTKAIWTIRHALNDATKERFIQTIPRRGYRFIFPVSVITSRSGAFRLIDLHNPGVAELTPVKASDSDDEVSPDSAAETVKIGEQVLTSLPAVRRRRNVSWFVYASVAAVILVGVALLGFFVRSSGRSGLLYDRGTKNDDAYRLYLLANNLMEQRGAKNVQRGLEAVDKAVALDPGFARAWAAKAMFHLLDPTLTPSQRYQLSKESVDKALALDADLSEAYSVLCYFKIGYEFDFAAGETICKRAVELDPNSARAHATYAQFLSTQKRFDESVAAARKAIDLEPQSYLNQMDYGLMLYYARRFEEEAQWKRLIELNPNDSFNYRRLSRCMERQGKESEAFEYLMKSLTMEGVDNQTLERFRSTFAASGLRGVALEEIKLSESRGYNTNKSFNIACLYARLGDKDKAFEYLEKTYQERGDIINELQVEPRLDPLRDDPRYVELVGRIFDH